MVRSGWGAYDESNLLSHLARAELALGHAGAARKAANRAVSVAVEQEAVPLQIQAHLTRAHIGRLTGEKPDAVLDDITSGLTGVERTGARAYEPFLIEERALAVSDQDELQRARSLFAASGATGHVQRLDTRLRGDG